MANVRRKEARRKRAFDEAKRVPDLEARIKVLQETLDSAERQLDERNNDVHDLRNKLMGVQLRCEELAEKLTARADEILRYEAAMGERGEHIEQLIKERRNARAARDAAVKRLDSLLAQDRDVIKLRRRLREAKERITELQTEISRLTKPELL